MKQKRKKLLIKLFLKLQIAKMANFGIIPIGARASGQEASIQFILLIENGLTEINTNYMNM